MSRTARGGYLAVQCKRACTLDADRRRKSLSRRSFAFGALVKIERLFTGYKGDTGGKGWRYGYTYSVTSNTRE